MIMFHQSGATRPALVDSLAGCNAYNADVISGHRFSRMITFLTTDNAIQQGFLGRALRIFTQ